MLTVTYFSRLCITWMRAAQDQLLWRASVEAYVLQCTSLERDGDDGINVLEVLQMGCKGENNHAG